MQIHEFCINPSLPLVTWGVISCRKSVLDYCLGLSFGPPTWHGDSLCTSRDRWTHVRFEFHIKEKNALRWISSLFLKVIKTTCVGKWLLSIKNKLALVVWATSQKPIMLQNWDTHHPVNGLWLPQHGKWDPTLTCKFWILGLHQSYHSV